MSEELGISGTPDSKFENSFSKYHFARVMAFVLMMLGISLLALKHNLKKCKQSRSSTFKNVLRVLNSMREHARLANHLLFKATDALGNAIYGAQSRLFFSTSLAQQVYFQCLDRAPEASLVILKPLVGGISGKWMIVLERWINYGRLWALA